VPKVIAPKGLPQYVSVYDEIKDRANRSLGKTYEIRFEWIASPTIPSSRLEPYKKQIVEALGPWLELGVETEGVRVFILDENGADVYNAHRLDRPGCSLPPASELPFEPNASIGFGSCSGRDGTLIMMLGSKSAPIANVHEVTHLGQYTLERKGVGSGPIFTRVNSNPCWIFEAEARLFEAVLAGDYNKNRDEIIAYLKRLVSGRGLQTEQKWVDFLVEREDVNSVACWEDVYRYNTLLLYERAYLDFGTARMTKWRIASVRSDWRVEFESEFGMTTRQWYERSVVPYIVDQLKVS
jgi:hypothetical protein